MRTVGKTIQRFRMVCIYMRERKHPLDRIVLLASRTERTLKLTFENVPLRLG